MKHSYWFSVPVPEAVTRDEIVECQTIDADCNDCRHFVRGKLETRMLSAMENGKAVMKSVNMGWFHGHCAKFDRPTIGQPNKWTGMPCFEHRQGKAGL